VSAASAKKVARLNGEGVGELGKRSEGDADLTRLNFLPVTPVYFCPVRDLLQREPALLTECADVARKPSTKAFLELDPPRHARHSRGASRCPPRQVWRTVSW
jgi:hypothetical protein